MIRGRSLITFALVASGLLLVSCSQDTSSAARIEQGPAGMHELTSLYERATAPQNRDVRKPIRDERTRALRMLAEKTQAFLAATAGWDNDARLTSLNESQRDCARNDVRSFRQALEGMETAARHSDLVRVRSEYSEVMDIYRHLRQHIGDKQS